MTNVEQQEDNNKEINGKRKGCHMVSSLILSRIRIHRKELLSIKIMHIFVLFP